MDIPSEKELQLLHTNICKSLGDTKRIQILYMLDEGPCNVSDLAAALDTPQPTISRHLAIVRRNSLVSAERDGQMVVYQLADQRIINVLDSMRTILRDLLELQSSIFV